MQPKHILRETSEYNQIRKQHHCCGELAEAIASELLEVDHIPDDRLLFATTADVTDIATALIG